MRLIKICLLLLAMFTASYANAFSITKNTANLPALAHYAPAVSDGAKVARVLPSAIKIAGFVGRASNAIGWIQMAYEGIMSGVDYVMDPANNQVRWEQKSDNIGYCYNYNDRCASAIYPTWQEAVVAYRNIDPNMCQVIGSYHNGDYVRCRVPYGNYEFFKPLPNNGVLPLTDTATNIQNKADAGNPEAQKLIDDVVRDMIKNNDPAIAQALASPEAVPVPDDQPIDEPIPDTKPTQPVVPVPDDLPTTAPNDPTNPSKDPANDPVYDPSNPTKDPNPGTNPSTNPGTNPKPVVNPVTNPDGSPNPNYDPNKNPDGSPAVNPRNNPDGSPNPNYDPNKNPDGSPAVNPKNNPDGSPNPNYNPDKNPDGSPKSSPATNPDGSPATNPDNNPGSNPSSNGKPFQLPAFCTWASAVCDWQKWTKEKYKETNDSVKETYKEVKKWFTDEPEPPEDEPVEIEKHDTPDFDLQTIANKTYISFPKNCPAPPSFSVFGSTLYFPIEIFCTFATNLGYIILASAWLRAVVIVGSTIT